MEFSTVAHEIQRVPRPVAGVLAPSATGLPNSAVPATPDTDLPPFLVNEIDGSPMVLVPAGEFQMGSDDSDGSAFDSEKPKHTVFLDAYYIGMYCVTNWQYKLFVDATGHRPPDETHLREPKWQGGTYSAELAQHPVVWVSWDDAAAYAEWAGCQLPTEAQWEKAARGPQVLTYPWGNDWDESKCRNGSNSGSEATCAIHAYPGGASGYGTANQSGNVLEWCADWWDSDYYARSPRENPTGPESGYQPVLRGGCSCLNDASDFRGAYRFVLPVNRNDFLGFRLVRIA